MGWIAPEAGVVNLTPRAELRYHGSHKVIHLKAHADEKRSHGGVYISQIPNNVIFVIFLPLTHSSMEM